VRRVRCGRSRASPCGARRESLEDHPQDLAEDLVGRRLRVGYTRAGRLIDMLERRGIISGYEGSKPRRVLVGEGELQRALEGSPEPVA